MDIREHTFTGIVGESGSGKSTIASLIMGRNFIKQGTLTIAGTNVSDINEGSLFKNINYVGIGSTFFKGTVRENLLFADPEASEEELWNALAECNIDGFFKEENGLDALLTENVGNLSGGGRNAGALLDKYPSAHVTAIDYSEVSVGKATTYNAEAIKNGRCKVHQGDVSALTLTKEKYDLATAFETIYFWPGLEKCFSQVAGVLKPGGVFMIVNESDGHDETSLKFEKIIEGMKCHTIEEIEKALIAAGFSKVKSDHHKSRPWITVIAKK